MAGATYRSGDGPLPHEVSDDEPELWLERVGGERVDLTLEPDPDRARGWVASPPPGVSQVMVRRGDEVRGRMWPGQSVRLDRVWSAVGDRLVIRQEDPE
jgi:hypothetical protein